ncbi:MAG: type II toxin-antitoxin system RelE/ParE family toxin [Magnetococcales bacterium]|nr:type II toxin-antitoxin system RelE/ParE family toxin [Magnetococcales bacterium]
MIASFKDKRTAQFAAGIRDQSSDQELTRQAQRCLLVLECSETLDDLKGLPSKGFRTLIGKRTGQYSIRINNQWRICFTYKNGEAHHVEIAKNQQ